MDEQKETNKQANCFLKIFIRKPINLPLKAIHVSLTGSRICSPQVKSAEHMTTAWITAIFHATKKAQYSRTGVEIWAIWGNFKSSKMKKCI